jgi:hypothetical protein
MTVTPFAANRNSAGGSGGGVGDDDDGLDEDVGGFAVASVTSAPGVGGVLRGAPVGGGIAGGEGVCATGGVGAADGSTGVSSPSAGGDSINWSDSSIPAPAGTALQALRISKNTTVVTIRNSAIATRRRSHRSLLNTTHRHPAVVRADSLALAAYLALKMDRQKGTT